MGEKMTNHGCELRYNDTRNEGIDVRVARPRKDAPPRVEKPETLEHLLATRRNATGSGWLEHARAASTSRQQSSVEAGSRMGVHCGPRRLRASQGDAISRHMLCAGSADLPRNWNFGLDARVGHLLLVALHRTSPEASGDAPTAEGPLTTAGQLPRAVR